MRASSCSSYLTTWARVPKDPGPTTPSIREHPQTPEWGGHAYMCQHGLLITKKTTKCTARITKEKQKVFRLFFWGGFFTDSLNFVQKSWGGRKCCFQILLYNFMSVLWLYKREGVFDFEDAHWKSCLPLIIWWSDAKAGDFLNRQEQNRSEQQLGNRNVFREPRTYSQHLCILKKK